MPPRKFDDSTETEIAARYSSGEPSTALAGELGTSPAVILGVVRRRGGAVRTISEAKRKLTPKQNAEIRRRYEGGETSPTLAAEHGVRTQVIVDAVRRAGGEIRPIGSFGWRGGRRAPDTKGYIKVMIRPDDARYPIASQMEDVTRTVYEHRLVMALAIGRPLQTQEQVHHINGDRGDNRLENLQLRPWAHGAGQAHRCLECGSGKIEHVPI